jgi:hypothetical protein
LPGRIDSFNPSSGSHKVLEGGSLTHVSRCGQTALLFHVIRDCTYSDVDSWLTPCQ